jgi:hypothetical protein
MMVKLSAQKYWWVQLAVLLILALAVLLVVQRWLPDKELIGTILTLSLVGVAFLWAYRSDRQRLWWAIIPGLAAFTLIASLLSDVLVGTDPQNDWINVLVLGAGTAIIAAVVSHNNARITLAIVTMFLVLVGFAVAPISILLKVILIAVDIAVVGWYIWRRKKA